MKIKRFIKLCRILSLCLAVMLCVSAAPTVGFAAGKDTDKGPDGAVFTVAAATDLHMDPYNTAPGTVNVLAAQNQAIVDALLWDCVNESADVLLLLGDITNASHPEQHEVLVEKLEFARSQGLNILVIPGNHDIGDISANGFAEFYADFGYNDAYSRDSDSLSYSFLIKEHLFIMLDTDGYLDHPTEPRLSETTLEWAEKQLEAAAENGWKVYCAGHYPILSYYLDPYEGQLELAELLRRYDVPLYLCGHLHERRMAESDGLAELVVEQSTQYPCTYCVITERDSEIRYSPKKIPVTRWAVANSSRDAILLSFETYQTEQFHAQSGKTVSILLKGRSFSDKEVLDAEDFIKQLMDGYWSGSLYYDLERLRSHPGYESFLKIAEGTVYARWVPSVLEDAVPYTGGFILKDHQLMEISRGN